MTKYAQQILDLVLRSIEHPTAEQIFLQMKQENSKIAQATVYNLSLIHICTTRWSQFSQRITQWRTRPSSRSSSCRTRTSCA